ncbi:APC family permease [Kocuria sp.]|uniref:APC family permease n=1 Tax=Kocuria sp. TaxID=1871328 RepID=UPI0026E0DC98|nr:APC family permease [Kocuria sp.]MDO5617638.1 APC family permease [Kocuria sp.]
MPSSSHSTPTTGQLHRRLSLTDATVIGIGSMVGAGVFVAFTPAAAHAGNWMLAAVFLAAVVAWCNATSTAQLAARYPSSGGTYVYASKRLGPWPGFMAGWSFVTGKTASAAAMAMTFGLYVAGLLNAAGLLARENNQLWAAVFAVVGIVALTGINLLGVTKTATVTKVLVACVLAVLLALGVAMAVVVAGGDSSSTAAPEPTTSGSAWGIFPAAAMLFFAFAGYARIATMGEEVRDPERTIPRAILGALALTLVLYATLGGLLLALLGPGTLANSQAALLTAVEHLGLSSGAAGVLAAAVTVAAALGTLGALLALIAGISRTSLAMARERDLPQPLTAVSRRGVPWLSEITTAVLVIALVLLTDVYTVIGFSSFGVLLYYALANLSALTMEDRPRWAPRLVNVVGLTGCLALAFALPWTSVLVMAGVLAIGLLGRVLLRR